MAWRGTRHSEKSTSFIAAVSFAALYALLTLSFSMLNPSISYALSGTWSWDTNSQDSIRASNVIANGAKLTSSQSGQGSILFVSDGGRSFTANEVYPQSAGNSPCLMNLHITLSATSGTSGTLTADDISGGACPDPAYLQGILNDIKANPNITISGTVPSGYSTTDIANSGGGTNGGANSPAGQWVAGQDGGITTSNYSTYTPDAIKEICSDTYLNGDGKPSGWTMDQAKYDTCVKNGQAAVDRASAEASKGQSSCAVDGIGWLVCPVSKAIATIVDTIFKHFIQPLMRVPPLTMDTGSNLYKAWGNMRNIANVVFVIAFMFIIYSQITSVGVSNYGIKKMLPKLILGAIFINISYFMCALFVDISNFLGMAVFDLLKAQYGVTMDGTSWEALIVALLAGGSLAGVAAIAGFATAAGSAMSILWMALPLLLGAILSVIVAALVLALRQALVIMLVVVSPLAIAAYLLPNTQSWFNKWKGLFTAMLVFFPLFSLVIGGSQLAAAILFASAKDLGAANPLQGAAVVLAAMAVQVLPFFTAPFVMKFSGSFLGNLGGKLQGSFSKLTAPAKDYAKKRSNIAQLRTQNNALTDMQKTGRFNGLRRAKGRLVHGFDRRGQILDKTLDLEQARRESSVAASAVEDPKLQGLYNQTKDAKATAHEAELQQVKNYARTVRDNPAASETQKASAQSTLDEMERKEASAYAFTLEEYNGDNEGKEALRRIVGDEKSSSARRAAALERLIKVGGPKDYEDIVEKFSKDSSLDNRIIRQKMVEGLNDSGMFKGSQTAQMGSGKFEFGGTYIDEKGKVQKNPESMQAMVADNAATGAITERNLATKLAGDDIDYLKEAIKSNVAAQRVIQQTATNALANKTLNVDVRHTRGKIQDLAGGTASGLIMPAGNMPTAAELPDPNRRFRP